MPPSPSPPLGLWQLAISTAHGGTTFKYSASLWTDSAVTPFGDGTSGDTLTTAFTGVLVSKVRMVFNGVSADFTLQDGHAGQYTLQQLANGRTELSSLRETSDVGNAFGILVLPQPPSGTPSDTFGLGDSSFPEAATFGGGKFKECTVGFDVSRTNEWALTKVRIGMVLDDYSSGNPNGAHPASSVGIGTSSYSASYGGWTSFNQLPGTSQVYVEGTPLSHSSAIVVRRGLLHRCVSAVPVRCVGAAGTWALLAR